MALDHSVILFSLIVLCFTCMRMAYILKRIESQIKNLNHQVGGGNESNY